MFEGILKSHILILPFSDATAKLSLSILSMHVFPKLESGSVNELITELFLKSQSLIVFPLSHESNEDPVP